MMMIGSDEDEAWWGDCDGNDMAIWQLMMHDCINVRRSERMTAYVDDVDDDVAEEEDDDSKWMDNVRRW